LWFAVFEEFVNYTQPDIDLLTLYDKKAIALLPRMLREICNITGVNCTNERIVNYFLQKHTAQKLNYEGMDSQAIINITLY
jgi:hypothetical protein